MARHGCSCDSIRSMLRSLKRTLSIPVVSCNFNEETGLWEPSVEQKNIEVFTLDNKTALGLGELYRGQAEMLAAQCDAKNDQGDEDMAIALIPEHWQVRIGADRPQLVVAYAEVVDGKAGRGRWPVTVPHYRHGPSVTPNFPSYTKGNFWARLILRDNSRILINAVSVAEAKRIVNSLKGFVSPGMIDPDQKIVTGERPAASAVGVRRVAPVFAAYFAKGQQEPPEWHLRLRK